MSEVTVNVDPEVVPVVEIRIDADSSALAKAAMALVEMLEQRLIDLENAAPVDGGVTPTQISDIIGLVNALAAKQPTSEKGAANGYASLDEFTKIAAQYLTIVNNLTTGGTTALLSAEQGKILKTQIDNINFLLNSDNVNLDSVQEIVDAIENVQTSLATILVNDLTTGGVTKALTAEMGKSLKTLHDQLVLVVNGKEPANTNIQQHISQAHAPANAQKNSDITKAEIEAKVIGEITSHTHPVTAQNLAITVRKISTATTLDNTDNGKVILLTSSCTVTIPNGLVTGFNVTFSTMAGVTLTYALGGSVVLINNAGTTMAEKLTHTIVNTGVANEYLTAGNL